MTKITNEDLTDAQDLYRGTSNEVGFLIMCEKELTKEYNKLTNKSTRFALRLLTKIENTKNEIARTQAAESGMRDILKALGLI